MQDFAAHVPYLNLFHLDYMASQKAARGFVTRLSGTAINAILPQHGSILGPHHVQAALNYLATLRCGLGLIYPELT